MKLFQVRKGQFVFYNNELHKVYSVTVMFKKSIHLYRLKDMQQVLTRANKIEKYQLEHRDTFIFCGERYTVDKNKIPKQGDYIVIVKPAPDLLDHYALNEIEKVDTIENGNIVTTQDNGVKHTEYVVMVPGKAEDGRDIAYFEPSVVPEAQLQVDESTSFFQKAEHQYIPVVGDIYYDAQIDMKTMVTAMSDTEVIFSHGHRLHIIDLLDKDRYTLIYSSKEQL